jgi:hypothetical protein
MNRLSSFTFKPSKQYIFTQKIKKADFKTIVPYKIIKSHSISNNQKIFNTIKPVKPFNRFIKQKVYASGSDPSTAFLHFMNKDSEKPYKKKISPIITEGIKNMPIKNLRWSLGTTCKCNNKDYLPKYEPYKEYFFTSHNNNRNNDFRMTYLPTDHISIRNPGIFKTIDADSKGNSSFLKMKSKFNFNSESESYWAPFASYDNNNFNRSSVHYNIINNKDNLISGKKELSINEKTINNKKKGVTEFFHLQRDYEPNYSPKFSNFLKENRNGFRFYKGAFTDLYDSYNRNGNIYQPFSIDNNKKMNRKKKNQYI